MKSKTCGNCKFRGENISYYDDETNEDVLTNAFLCERIKQGNGEDNDYESVPPGIGEATVEDGSGYMATLCVDSDFGCNLFKQR